MNEPERATEPIATVVIVTRNRRDEVVNAARSAVAQSGGVEVIVLDDGSTDGTLDALIDVQGLRVERFEQSAGLVVRRNQAAELAAAPIIVSLDDDAEFTDAATVAATVDEFAHPRIGAVAMPYVDRPQGPAVLQRAPDPRRTHVTNRFRGTAHALRRNVFLALGGYRSLLFHAAEEPDLSIRMLNAGYVVRLGNAPPLIHHSSTKRDPERGWFYESRNGIVFGWQNVPLPHLPLYLGKSAAYAIWLGCRVRRPGLFARGVAAGFALTAARRIERQPVCRRTWRLYSRLARGPMLLEDVVGELPAAESAAPAGVVYTP